MFYEHIVIYGGEGVGSFSLKQLQKSLKEVLPLPHKIVNHTHFLNPNWEKGCKLLVFPGGRDLPYHQRLQGEANKRIHKYVSTGGKYLGLCAGAYYASAEVEFEKGGELEVLGKRELAFFPGKSVGPALGLRAFRYESESGMQAAPIKWHGGAKNKVYKLYYNGGCTFEGAEKALNTQVLAFYETKQPAIVLCRVGEGEALLSGLHPEFPLKEGEEERQAFWRDFISLIKI